MPIGNGRFSSPLGRRVRMERTRAHFLEADLHLHATTNGSKLTCHGRTVSSGVRALGIRVRRFRETVAADQTVELRFSVALQDCSGKVR